MAREFFERGVYTAPEAAKYTRIPISSIRRWAAGYSRGDTIYAPVIQRDYEPVNGQLSLSFLDIMEMMFLKSFRHHSVTLQTIRIATHRAQNLLASSHPFSTHTFYTDGKHILAEIESETGVTDLVNLIKSQYEIAEIVRPVLRAGIEFGANGQAESWYPAGTDKPIVMTPTRNFGKPTVEGTGIPTDTLFNLHLSGNAIEDVASWYGLPAHAVKAAIEYERSLAA